MNQGSVKSAVSHKEIASEFLSFAASTNVREGYGKHVAQGFRHHNPYFRGDANSLMLAQEENAKTYPSKVLEIKHVIEDGDLVAIHAHVKLKPDDVGLALVHIFRFEGDRIAELWDIAQQLPENSPNQYGAF
jgi:predicted SnoaL-like aldol condensation-catalyzing enzyme